MPTPTLPQNDGGIKQTLLFWLFGFRENIFRASFKYKRFRTLSKRLQKRSRQVFPDESFLQ